jgi:hypothetical protein
MIIEEKKEDDEWKSCCLKVDKNMVKYIVQVGILSGLILFSASMLVIEKECNSQRNYSSLLMICLGVFLPQPKMN